MRIECTKCRYVMDKPDIPRRCPYCSAEGGMRKAKIAQDLVDESQ
ncbi:MAG: hypothetical protein Q7S65_06235 [Nanoarchaeota archaeon]|nr:hypothetical protein [Nanoarchaeota archaeon]